MRIPEYQQQVQPDAMPDAKLDYNSSHATPEVFGAGQARDLQGFGAAVQNTGELIQHETNRAMVRDALNTARTQSRELLAGIAGRKGKDALTSIADTTVKLDEINRNALAGLANPAQKKMFGGEFAGLAESQLDEAAKHQGREAYNFNLQTYEAGNLNHTRDAELGLGRDEDHWRSIQGNQDKILEFHHVAPDSPSGQAFKLQASTDFHLKVSERESQKSLDAARRYVNLHADEMAPAAVAESRDKLQARADEQELAQQARRLQSLPEEKRKAAAAELDKAKPGLGNQALDRAEEISAFETRRKQVKENTAVTESIGLIGTARREARVGPGEPLPELSFKLQFNSAYTGASDWIQDSLADFARQGHAARTDPATYVALTEKVAQTATDNRPDLSSALLLSGLTKITQEDYAGYQALLADLKDHPEKAELLKADLRQAQAVFDAQQSRRNGVQPNPDNEPQFKQQRDSFATDYLKEIVRRQKASGDPLKPLPEKEKREILAGLSAEGGRVKSAVADPLQKPEEGKDGKPVDPAVKSGNDNGNQAVVWGGLPALGMPPGVSIPPGMGPPSKDKLIPGVLDSAKEAAKSLADANKSVHDPAWQGGFYKGYYDAALGMKKSAVDVANMAGKLLIDVGRTMAVPNRSDEDRTKHSLIKIIKSGELLRARLLKDVDKVGNENDKAEYIEQANKLADIFIQTGVTLCLETKGHGSSKFNRYQGVTAKPCHDVEFDFRDKVAMHYNARLRKWFPYVTKTHGGTGFVGGHVYGEIAVFGRPLTIDLSGGFQEADDFQGGGWAEGSNVWAGYE